MSPSLPCASAIRRQAHDLASASRMSCASLQRRGDQLASYALFRDFWSGFRRACFRRFRAGAAATAAGQAEHDDHDHRRSLRPWHRVAVPHAAATLPSSPPIAGSCSSPASPSHALNRIGRFGVRCFAKAGGGLWWTRPRAAASPDHGHSVILRRRAAAVNRPKRLGNRWAAFGGQDACVPDLRSGRLQNRERRS